jgi:hypothetical protein
MYLLFSGRRTSKPRPFAALLRFVHEVANPSNPHQAELRDVIGQFFDLERKERADRRRSARRHLGTPQMQHWAKTLA